MNTTITWHRSTTAKRSGFYEHTFVARGAEVKTVAAWLRKDNESHGEWIMDEHADTLLSGTSQAGQPAEPLSFKFHINESATDAEAGTRTRNHIMLLKLSSAGALDLKWNQH